MRFGDLLELLLTMAVLAVIWGVPRLALGARRSARKKSKEKAAEPAVSKSGPEPSRDDSYDRDDGSAAHWLERQRMLDETIAKDSANKDMAGKIVPGVEIEPEIVSVFAEEASLPVAPIRKISRRSRVSRLRQAIIWKEILDRPKALRAEPFEERLG